LTYDKSDAAKAIIENAADSDLLDYLADCRDVVEKKAKRLLLALPDHEFEEEFSTYVGMSVHDFYGAEAD